MASKDDVEDIRKTVKEIMEVAKFLYNNPDTVNDEDGGQLYRDNVEGLQYEVDQLKEHT